MLKPADIAYLDEKGINYSTYPDGANTLLVLHGYELPDGYNPPVTDVLILVPADYPDAQLDMWWCYPVVTFASNGARPQASEVMQEFSAYAPEPGRSWQRFSRHPTWRAGTDDLRSFLRWMRYHLEHDVTQASP